MINDQNQKCRNSNISLGLSFIQNNNIVKIIKLKIKSMNKLIKQNLSRDKLI